MHFIDGKYNDNLCKLNKIWFLGADIIDIFKINSKDEVRCGENSCYEESLRQGKICKQGRLNFE